VTKADPISIKEALRFKTWALNIPPADQLKSRQNFQDEFGRA